MQQKIYPLSVEKKKLKLNSSQFFSPPNCLLQEGGRRHLLLLLPGQALPQVENEPSQSPGPTEPTQDVLLGLVEEWAEQCGGLGKHLHHILRLMKEGACPGPHHSFGVQGGGCQPFSPALLWDPSWAAVARSVLDLVTKGDSVI